MLQRITHLAIAAPWRITAAAVLVTVAAGIFGIPVAESLSASGLAARAVAAINRSMARGPRALRPVATIAA